MIVDCAVYREGKREDGVALDRAVEESRKDGAFAWIGLYEPTAAEFDSIRAEFALHPLAVEDAIEAHQRPKLEVYDDMIFVVLKTARYVDPNEVVKLGEILVFLGNDFIITVRHGEASPLDGVRQGLEDDPDQLKHGPGAVLHAVVDRVVDDYGPAIDGLSDDVVEVEEQVFTPERANPAERIYRLKREVLQFLHATVPLLDPVERLAKGGHDQVHPEVRAYFRDVNDHLVRARDQLDGLNDLLSSVLAGEPDPDQRAPERGHAQDLGLGRDRRGADDDRRDLRHELRAHAGAGLDLRLPAGAGADGVRVHVPVLAVQAGGLAGSGAARAMAEDCIFCKIVAGELPSERVDEDEHTIAFMDLNPWTRGHALVIPRRHSRNLYEVPDEDLEHAVGRGEAPGARDARPTELRRRQPAQRMRAGRLADRLPHPHPRDPALRGRSPAGPRTAASGRAGRACAGGC